MRGIFRERESEASSTRRGRSRAPLLDEREAARRLRFVRALEDFRQSGEGRLDRVQFVERAPEVGRIGDPVRASFSQVAVSTASSRASKHADGSGTLPRRAPRDPATRLRGAFSGARGSLLPRARAAPSTRFRRCTSDRRPRTRFVARSRIRSGRCAGSWRRRWRTAAMRMRRSTRWKRPRPRICGLSTDGCGRSARSGPPPDASRLSSRATRANWKPTPPRAPRGGVSSSGSSPMRASGSAASRDGLRRRFVEPAPRSSAAVREIAGREDLVAMRAAHLRLRSARVKPADSLPRRQSRTDRGTSLERDPRQSRFGAPMSGSTRMPFTPPRCSPASPASHRPSAGCSVAVPLHCSYDGPGG